jgi:hypothetical protein
MAEGRTKTFGVGGFTGVTTVSGHFSQQEVDFARSVAEYHPLAKELDLFTLVLESLPIFREAKRRIKSGYAVEPQDMAEWTDNDPVCRRALSQLTSTQNAIIFATMMTASYIWNEQQQN